MIYIFSKRPRSPWSRPTGSTGSKRTPMRSPRGSQAKYGASSTMSRTREPSGACVCLCVRKEEREREGEVLDIRKEIQRDRLWRQYDYMCSEKRERERERLCVCVRLDRKKKFYQFTPPRNKKEAMHTCKSTPLFPCWAVVRPSSSWWGWTSATGGRPTKCARRPSWPATSSSWTRY